jgi:hypothetical protein
VTVKIEKGGIMHRTSIGIKDADFKKIQANAEKKSLNTADYIRLLVNIGLKVEEAAEKSLADRPTPADHPQDTEALWKSLLACGLETRFLIRHLIKQGFPETIEQRQLFLDDTKETALIKAEELLNNLNTSKNP